MLKAGNKIHSNLHLIHSSVSPGILVAGIMRPLPSCCWCVGRRVTAKGEVTVRHRQATEQLAHGKGSSSDLVPHGGRRGWVLVQLSAATVGHPQCETAPRDPAPRWGCSPHFPAEPLPVGTACPALPHSSRHTRSPGQGSRPESAVVRVGPYTETILHLIFSF